MITREEVSNVGEVLHSHASPMCYARWMYSKESSTNRRIQHIRYSEDFTGKRNPLRRLKHALYSLYENICKEPSTIERMTFNLAVGEQVPLRTRIRRGLTSARVILSTRKRLPAGVVGGGRIIVLWEEEGKYLQLVQPSVGALIAEFLQECPEHPHAQRIAEEVMTIHRECYRD